MRFWANSAVLVLSAILFSSCSSQVQMTNTNDSQKSIVAEFSGNTISNEEFESAFKSVGLSKTGSKADTLAEKQKFLELYVNYKMKLNDAVQKGYDNDPDVMKEYESYRKSIASSLLIEKEVVAKGIQQIYDRRKIEMRISQIFIKMDSTQADLGKSKAQKVMDRINAGEKFEDLVKECSDDESSKNKGGDIYYVTAGSINVPEIENALYATDEGKICSKLLTTQYGFHILKVTEKQPRVYGMNVSHIMSAYRTAAEQKPDTSAAKKKIMLAQDDLKNGMSFEDAAKKYSDDKVSADKGGLIGLVDRGRFIREFDEYVMKMKEHEVSGVVETPYGYHIIRVNSIVPYPPLSQERESLKKTYEQLNYKQDFDNYIAKLRSDLKYQLNVPLYSKLVTVKDSFYVADTTFYNQIRKNYKDSVLVMINNKPFAADSLFTFMINSTDFFGTRYSKDVVNKAHDKYFTAVLLAEKGTMVYNGTPDFEKIMADYKKGILLFKISENEIWNKVKVDSNQIKEYWVATKDNYTVKPRVTFREIYLTTDQLKDTVYTALKSGAAFDEMLKKSIRPHSEEPKNKVFDEDMLAQKAYELKNVGDITEPFVYNGGWSIVRLDKREDKRIKTFEEAKPEVSSILQEKESKRLDEAYVARLKENYKPKLFLENIKN